MKYAYLLLWFISFSVFAQVHPNKNTTSLPTKENRALSTDTVEPKTTSMPSLASGQNKKAADTIATIDMYKIRNWRGSETAVDTSLSLKKYYAINYLRKDLFGLLPFANDGQTYTTLDYGRTTVQGAPKMGFSARSYAYQEIQDVSYFHVPTAFSEAYYRSAIKQGQNLDAFIATNTSKAFNVFVGYKGLRSLGSYINQLTSIGNFKVGASYDAPKNNYHLQVHVMAQDLSLQENGGITDMQLFEANKGIYTNRERLNVYFRNANNLFKGLRSYVNHKYKFVGSEQNAIWLKHQFIYEYKNNLFTQSNTNPDNYYYSENPIPLPQDQIVQYFGAVYASQAHDKVRNENVYNKLALSYASASFGELEFFADHLHYDYKYQSVVLNEEEGVQVPSYLRNDLVTLGGAYRLETDKFNALFQAKQAVLGGALTELNAQVQLTPYENVHLKAQYDFISKMPDFAQQLFQSTYVSYNWSTAFNNEKHSNLKAEIETPWANASFQYRLITDKIYYSNDTPTLDTKGRQQQLVVTPKQYSGVINYLGVKLNKEIKWGKWALDNTLLYQATVQDQDVLHVPTFTTRNTFYFTDYWFKKALFLQTGITFSYFTNYYADGYNPVISDFYVQNQQKIGGFPVLDFFINAKIRTARVYFNIEHFNAKLGKSTYYTAPNYPYREMAIRLGVVWDFFN